MRDAVRDLPSPEPPWDAFEWGECRGYHDTQGTYAGDLPELGQRDAGLEDAIRAEQAATREARAAKDARRKARKAARAAKPKPARGSRSGGRWAGW